MKTVLRNESLVHRLLACSSLLLCGWVACVPCVAQAQPSWSYWVSMRDVSATAQARFVTLSPVPSATHSVAFAGCHRRTWYLEPRAGAIVEAARVAGETVQIHRGPSGSLPAAGTVICLIQADG